MDELFLPGSFVRGAQDVPAPGFGAHGSSAAPPQRLHCLGALRLSGGSTQGHSQYGMNILEEYAGSSYP